MKKIILFIAFLIPSIFLFSNKEEKEIIAITKDFNDYTTELKKPGNIEKLFALLDTNFSEEKVIMNLGNEASINNLDRKLFVEYTSKFKGGTDYRVDYRFKRIIRSGASTFFGYTMFTAEYDVYIKDSLAYSGEQIQTLYYTKRGGKWKIFKSSMIDTRAEVYISNCPCNIRKLGNERYEAKLRIPAGGSRTEYLYQFEFELLGGNKYYVFMNGDKFVWEEQRIELKNINDEYLSKKAGKFVVAKEKMDVLKELLQYYNPHSCSSINIY